MAREALEDLLRERGGGRGDGRWALADRRLDPCAASGVECHAEGAVEQRAGSARFEGVAHLAEDLPLAGHERVEAGGDPEQVQRCGLVRETVRERREGSCVRAGQCEERVVGSLCETVVVVRSEVELRAVARREDDRLLCLARAARQAASQRGGRVEVDRDPFAQLDGRGVVRDAGERELHDAKWVRGRTNATSEKPATSDQASRRPWRPVSRRSTSAAA